MLSTGTKLINTSQDTAEIMKTTDQLGKTCGLVTARQKTDMDWVGKWTKLAGKETETERERE